MMFSHSAPKMKIRKFKRKYQTNFSYFDIVWNLNCILYDNEIKNFIVHMKEVTKSTLKNFYSL